MKHSIYILFALAAGLSSCSSQKKLETKTPFVIGSASCQAWMGGREESSSGLTLKLPVSKMTDGGITFQNVYFRGKVAKVFTESVNGEMFAMGRFETQEMGKSDIVMHLDPKKEVGNKPPDIKKKEEVAFPFELKKDEAVLGYLEKGREKYVKISGIKEKPARIHKGKPKN